MMGAEIGSSFFNALISLGKAGIGINSGGHLPPPR
jgi:hypothetical protein